MKDFKEYEKKVWDLSKDPEQLSGHNDLTKSRIVDLKKTISGTLQRNGLWGLRPKKKILFLQKRLNETRDLWPQKHCLKRWETYNPKNSVPHSEAWWWEYAAVCPEVGITLRWMFHEYIKGYVKISGENPKRSATKLGLGHWAQIRIVQRVEVSQITSKPAKDTKDRF